jgi:hypothetical protein
MRAESDAASFGRRDLSDDNPGLAQTNRLTIARRPIRMPLPNRQCRWILGNVG